MATASALRSSDDASLNCHGKIGKWAIAVSRCLLSSALDLRRWEDAAAYGGKGKTYDIMLGLTSDTYCNPILWNLESFSSDSTLTSQDTSHDNFLGLFPTPNLSHALSFNLSGIGSYRRMYTTWARRIKDRVLKINQAANRNNYRISGARMRRTFSFKGIVSKWLSTPHLHRYLQNNTFWPYSRTDS